ncbi:MAG: VanZ family protein [Gammaproteobacteria bacterium]
MSLKHIFVIGLYVVVFVLAIIPTSLNSSISFIPFQDKVIHLMTFFLLSVATLYAFKITQFFYVFIYIVCFGIGIEIVQYFISYRSSEILDIFADIIGALIGFKVLKKI